MRKKVLATAGALVVLSILVLVWHAAPPASGQQPREEKRMTGEVVGTTDTQVTVRAADSGEVVVWNAGWRKVPGTNKSERNPDHLALIGQLKKGDRVVVRGRYLEEMWIIDEIARADGERSELAALTQEVAALRSQIAQLRVEVAELKELVKRLAEK